MTAPDLIHLWARAGDPNSGQLVGVTAPETRLAFVADGPTLTEVRAALRSARRYIARGEGLRVTTLAQIDAAIKMLGE